MIYEAERLRRSLVPHHTVAAAACIAAAVDIAAEGGIAVVAAEGGIAVAAAGIAAVVDSAVADTVAVVGTAVAGTVVAVDTAVADTAVAGAVSEARQASPRKPGRNSRHQLPEFRIYCIKPCLCSFLNQPGVAGIVISAASAPAYMCTWRVSKRYPA